MTDCELCGGPSDHVVDSPVIPWSKLALCEEHYQQYQDDEIEIQATVRRLE